MNRFIGGALSLLIAVAPMLQPGMSRSGQLRGRVVDVAGRPVPNVRVNDGGRIMLTAVDGTYVLEPGWSMVHFSRLDYRAELRARSALSAPVVMHRTSEPERVLTRCATDARGEDVGWLRIPTPPGVQRTIRGSTDSVHVVWRHGRAVLSKGSGPTWSHGLPLESDVAGLRDVVDRELLEPAGDDGSGREWPVIDYRGTRPDGSRFRFLGRPTETYRYDRLSPEAAAVFDRMLDAVCLADFSG